MAADEDSFVSTLSPHLHGVLTIAERLSRPDIAAQCISLAASLAPIPRLPALVQPPEEDAEFFQELGRQVVEHTTNPPLSWADIVFEKDGEAVADSRKVAEVFEKEHKDVLKRIRTLDKDLSIELADAGLEWSARNFALSSYSDSTGRSLPCFHMTRDGFSLLAMGFTGKRALEFKLGFIQAFNAMEDELRSQHIKKLSGHITDLSMERDRAVLERKGIADRFSGIQAKLRATEKTLERSKGELAVLQAAPKPTVPELLFPVTGPDQGRPTGSATGGSSRNEEPPLRPL